MAKVPWFSQTQEAGISKVLLPEHVIGVRNASRGNAGALVREWERLSQMFAPDNVVCSINSATSATRRTGNRRYAATVIVAWIRTRRVRHQRSLFHLPAGRNSVASSVIRRNQL